MDLKNFVDIISTPKNIGTNKWVLNNFGDLKSSNDYLHILRLRYDNRWLKIYWDSKLKEVEKDLNFYVATPIKNKFLHKNNTLSKDLIILKNFQKIELKGSLDFTQSIDGNLKTSLNKSLNKNISEGVIKKNMVLPNYNEYTPNLINNIDTIFLNFKKNNLFFKKNEKQALKSLSETGLDVNLWNLNKKNNVQKIYPNNIKVLLSGNLLLNSQEGEGKFNTNSISIKNLN